MLCLLVFPQYKKYMPTSTEQVKIKLLMSHYIPIASTEPKHNGSFKLKENVSEEAMNCFTQTRWLLSAQATWSKSISIRLDFYPLKRLSPHPPIFLHLLHLFSYIYTSEW